MSGKREDGFKVRVTLNAVNRACTAAGIKAELIRAPEGYHYFIGDDVAGCKTTSDYNCHTGGHTVETWVQIARELKTEHVHHTVRNHVYFANGAEVEFPELRPSYVALKGEFTADELEQLAYALRNPRKL